MIFLCIIIDFSVNPRYFIDTFFFPFLLSFILTFCILYCTKCLTPIVLLSLWYNPLSNSIFSNNTLVYIVQIQLALECNVFSLYQSRYDTYVFFSMYRSDTTSSRTQCLQSVSIQIRHYMYTLVCIVQIQLALELNVFSLHQSRNDTICIL